MPSIFPNNESQITEAHSEICQTLRWRILQKKKKMINFRKHTIFDVSHGSEYTSGLLKLF